MGELWGRRVIVELGTNNSSGVRYDDLRVTFSVSMTDGSSPNEGKIEVYGVAASTIATMQADNAVIRLLVGYASQGGAPRLLFQGSPIKGGAKLEVRGGTERVLVVEALDGGRELAQAHMSESFSTASTSAQVFAKIAESLGVPLGNVEGVVGTISFPHGIMLNGPAREQMDRIAEMSGSLWGIRDGALQVWSRGDTTGEPAVVFSSAAGNLIGVPKPTDNGVEITGLLAPSLRPGKPFRVSSLQVNGDYVATEVTFRGDTGWSTDFYVIAKGTAL